MVEGFFPIKEAAMTRLFGSPELPLDACAAKAEVEVCGAARGSQQRILAGLSRVFFTCGCPVVAFNTSVPRGIDCRFKVKIEDALTLYAGLVEAGVELTRESHRRLTELCVLRKYDDALERECAVGVWLHVGYERAGAQLVSTPEEMELA
jgi:hypothetical protein